MKHDDVTLVSRPEDREALILELGGHLRQIEREIREHERTLADLPRLLETLRRERSHLLNEIRACDTGPAEEQISVLVVWPPKTRMQRFRSACRRLFRRKRRP